MAKSKFFLKNLFSFYVIFIFIAIISGLWLVYGVNLKNNPVAAASLNSVIVEPGTDNVDNLLGNINATWKFTVDNNTLLTASNTAVEITFPNNILTGDWDLSNIAIIASTTDPTLTFATTTPGIDMHSLVIMVAANQTNVSNNFFLTITGVRNPVADITDAGTYNWSVRTCTLAQPGNPQSFCADLDTTATGQATLKRRGGAIMSWTLAVSNYGSQATGVQYDATYTASTTINIGEKININFPSSFDLSQATTSDQIIVDGGSARVASTSIATSTDYGMNIISLTISGGSINPAATSTVHFSIGNITNPAKGAYNGISLFTSTVNNGLVDGIFRGRDPEAEMGGPPPVDSIQIGGNNTISGTIKIRNASGTLETISSSAAAQMKIGMDCPDKMFFVGTTAVNSNGSFSYDHLLDARYVLFIMPVETNNKNIGDFFKNYIQPAHMEINVSDGETVQVEPVFSIPDSVILAEVANGPANGSDAFVRAYNGVSESFSPIFKTSAYDNIGFDSNGHGYISIPVKTGYNWKINIMSDNMMATGSAEFWPPIYDPVNIPAGVTTTTLPTKSFMTADKILNVRIKNTDNSIIDGQNQFVPCINVRRASADSMMDRGSPVCNTTDVNGENLYQVKVPSGAYVVETMIPGAGHVEKPVTINSATTTLDIMIDAPESYISGTVVDADNFPIQGVSVFAHGNTGNFADDMTDAAGAFRIYVNPGVYSLDAFAPGFGPLERQTNVMVTASANATTTWIISNNDFSKITGRVYTDSNNNGQYDAGEGLSNVKIFSHNATTDKGSFAITLTNGEYTLRVPKASGYMVGGFSDIIGALEPIENINANSDISGQDFSVAGLGYLSVTISNGNSSGINNFFLHANNISNNKGNGTDSWHASGTDLVAIIDLPAGTYKLHIGTPAYGDLIDLPANASASSTTIIVGNNNALTVFLPTMVTVSGTVANGASAAVWISRTDGPGKFTTTANATSTAYSLKVPSGFNYLIGASLPGYTNTPQELNNLTTSTTTNLTLTAAAAIISGTLSGGGSALSEGFVWAEKSGNEGWTGTEINADGSYSLNIGSGTWSVRGDGPCFYMSDSVEVTGSQTLNIDLTSQPNCSLDTPQAQSVTPSSGGAMKKQIGDNNIDLNIPANALGTGSSNVTVTITKPNVLPPANIGAFPIENAAVSISAANSSGSSISSLNSSANISLTYQEDDLPSSANESDLQLAFWNTTSQTWDTVNATVDTDNNIITASIDHFTDFAPILPTASGVPDTPQNFTVSKYSSSGSDTKLNLSWTQVNGADSYYVYRGTSPASNLPYYTSVSGGSTVAYTDSGLSNNTTYYYKLTAHNSNGESAATATSSAATCSSVANGTVSGPSCSLACNNGYTLNNGACSADSSSGGGNASLFITYCETIEYDDWQETCNNGWQYRNILSRSPNNCVLTTDQNNQAKKECVQIEEENNIEPELFTSPEPKKSTIAQNVANKFAQWISEVMDEANQIIKADINSFLSKLGLKRNLPKEQDSARKYVKNLIKDVKKITKHNEYALINFIAYGTTQTKKLGQGERAGVINSFKTAFDKLPATEMDWSDIIKIANGRWPSEKSVIAENRAKEKFKTIYLRESNMNNPHDNAAVTVIAYGLRPADRNLNSEKTAIKIFKDIYKYNPRSAIDWDTVRAIAYSGATR